MKTTLRIATRKSPLAMWQAEYVRDQLASKQPGVQVELVPMTTKGDRLLGQPLSNIGGKGLFIKELERAMLEQQADIAVHSIKDVPAVLPQGFSLGPILSRENPFDAFVSPHYPSLESLPAGARVGTCSLRRRAQLLHKRPDVKVLDLRGNVNTRLQSLDDGNYEAIILAAAGLYRLNLEGRIRQLFEPDICLPAVGQGAIVIEMRDNDQPIARIMDCLDDPVTRVCITAERAMNRVLDGGCQAPVAGFATLDGDQITLTGLVASPDGKQIITSRKQADRDAAEQLGESTAEDLLARGAAEILSALVER